MDNSNSISEAYFKQCNRGRQMKIHSSHPGLMVKFLNNRMREDVRTWVKDHKNIHGIVEKTNSNKRRKVERQMASQTQIQVAEEDEQDIKWGKSVRHSKSSALAKQLKSLLTDVKNIRTITLQYAYVTATLQSIDGTITVMSEKAYSQWIKEKSSKPKF
jgi:uncharacterized protein YwgA